YVADGGRIQKRDTQGNWSLIAEAGTDLAQVVNPSALAVGMADSLYVAESDDLVARTARIQKRDAQGNWSVLAARGFDPGEVLRPLGLGLDAAGNLYVGDDGQHGSGARIQKRDAQGNWSIIATLDACTALT